jgi:hypothetical protein
MPKNEPYKLRNVWKQIAACKTRGQDGIAHSFPVGLLPPLQHAGLSRRWVVNRQFGNNKEIQPQVLQLRFRMTERFSSLKFQFT